MNYLTAFLQEKEKKENSHQESLLNLLNPDSSPEIIENGSDKNLLNLLNPSETEPAQSTLADSDGDRRSEDFQVGNNSYLKKDNRDREFAARQKEHARILEVFPEAQPARGRRWVIEGDVYDHENAVRLAAYRSSTTTNGYPISIDCGAVYREANGTQSTLSAGDS